MRLHSISFTAALSFSVLLAAISSAAWADNYNREVLINNHTSQDIIEFYGSNTGTSDWQEDILGDYIIPAGESANINFNDNTGYCMFDFLAVFEDKSESIEERFNVCDYGELTFVD